MDTFKQNLKVEKSISTAGQSTPKLVRLESLIAKYILKNVKNIAVHSWQILYTLAFSCIILIYTKFANFADFPILLILGFSL